MNYPAPTEHVKPDKNGSWRVSGRFIAATPELQAEQRARLVALVGKKKATRADVDAYNIVATIKLAEATDRHAKKAADEGVKRGKCAVDRRSVARANGQRIWSGWL